MISRTIHSLRTIRIVAAIAVTVLIAVACGSEGSTVTQPEPAPVTETTTIVTPPVTSTTVQEEPQELSATSMVDEVDTGNAGDPAVAETEPEPESEPEPSSPGSELTLEDCIAWMNDQLTLEDIQQATECALTLEEAAEACAGLWAVGDFREECAGLLSIALDDGELEPEPPAATEPEPSPESEPAGEPGPAPEPAVDPAEDEAVENEPVEEAPEPEPEPQSEPEPDPEPAITVDQLVVRAGIHTFAVTGRDFDPSLLHYVLVCGLHGVAVDSPPEQVEAAIAAVTQQDCSWYADEIIRPDAAGRWTAALPVDVQATFMWLLTDTAGNPVATAVVYLEEPEPEPEEVGPDTGWVPPTAGMTPADLTAFPECDSDPDTWLRGDCVPPNSWDHMCIEGSVFDGSPLRCDPPNGWERLSQYQPGMGYFILGDRVDETPRLSGTVLQFQAACRSQQNVSCWWLLSLMKWSLDYMGARPSCILGEYLARVDAAAERDEIVGLIQDRFGWHNCATVIDPLVGDTPASGNDVRNRLSDTPGITFADRCRAVLPVGTVLDTGYRLDGDPPEYFDPAQRVVTNGQPSGIQLSHTPVPSVSCLHN